MDLENSQGRQCNGAGTSSDVHQPAGKTKTAEGNLEERLEEFCKIFVKSYETKISEYKKEAEVGGKGKIGKTAKLLGLGAGAAASAAAACSTVGSIASKAKSAQSCTTSAANWLLGKNHRNQAKQVMVVIALMNKAELRKILVEAAGDIFAAFEQQFTNVTDASGSWIRAMEKLSVEAMDRSINYIKDYEKNHGDSKPRVNRDFVVRSVIHGESKKSTSAQFADSAKLHKVKHAPDKVKHYIPKPGHTLRYQDQEWKISDLYKSIGIVQIMPTGECISYFIRRYEDKAHIYGYRLFFTWEQDVLKNSYRKFVKPAKEYKYKLNKEDLEIIVLKILEDINRSDPEISIKTIHETNERVCQIQEKVETISTVVDETFAEINGIQEKVDGVNKTAEETLVSVYKNQSTLEEILDSGQDFKETLSEIHTKTDEMKNGISKIQDTADEFAELFSTICTNGDDLKDIAQCTKETQSAVHQILDEVSRPDTKSSYRSFNMAAPTHYFVGRDQALEGVHKLIQGNGVTVLSQMTVVAGLGGIGKSELARKYASVYKSEYENRVIWINAETFDLMSESFRDLAKDILYKKRTDRHSFIKTLDIKSIVKDVYAFFLGGKSLFIFDNAEKFKSLKYGDEGINAFLPLTTEFINEVHVLITSRNQKWPDIELYNLDVFSDEESTKFIKTVLNIDEQSLEKEIGQLAECLQNFPLALQQAVIFIKENNMINENSGSKFGIDDYLKRFQTQQEELLDYNFFEETTDIYTKTVFTTWKITIKKIESNERYGTRAKEILDTISYIAPNNIVPSLFTKGLADDDLQMTQFRFALQLLKQYSMVNSHNGKNYFNIHRLVQRVTRINLQNNGEQSNVMKTTFGLLKQYFTSLYITLDQIFESDLLASHLKTFLSHIENSMNDEMFRNEYIYNVLLWMADSFNDDDNIIEVLDRILELPYRQNSIYDCRIFENCSQSYSKQKLHKKERTILNRSLRIKKELCGAKSIAYVETLEMLSKTYNIRERKKENLLILILKIKEGIFGIDSNELLCVLETLANIYNNVARPKDEIRIRERILKITEIHRGPEHYDVYLVLNELYYVYGTMSDHEKRKEILERMLSIQEKYSEEGCYIVETLVNLSQVYKALGESDKQMQALQRALDIRVKEYGPKHDKVWKIEYLIKTASWKGYH